MRKRGRLDELGGFFDRFGRSEKNVKMVGHDHEAVEKVAILIAVAEEDGQEKFGVCGSLEEANAVVGDGGEGVGLGVEAHF